jgi:hypothetical protein
MELVMGSSSDMATYSDSDTCYSYYICYSYYKGGTLMSDNLNKELTACVCELIDKAIAIAKKYNIDNNEIIDKCAQCLTLSVELGDFSKY